MNGLDAQITEHAVLLDPPDDGATPVLGFMVNHKKLYLLVRGLILAGMAPGPNTNRRQDEPHSYPWWVNRNLQVLTRLGFEISPSA
jgi:putative transposase